MVVVVVVVVAAAAEVEVVVVVVVVHGIIVDSGLIKSPAIAFLRLASRCAPLNTIAC